MAWSPDARNRALGVSSPLEWPAAGHDDQIAPDSNHPTTPSRWLEQYGGFVLIVVGTLGLGLAGLRSDQPAIAPLLVVFGAAMVILGAFYSRIVGSVEASRDGVRIVINEIAGFAEERGLSAKQTTVLIEQALSRYDFQSFSRPATLGAAREAADQTLKMASVSIDASLQEHVLNGFRDWLTLDGYHVVKDAGHDVVDLVAVRRDEMLAAVVELAPGGVRVEMIDSAVMRLERLPNDPAVLHPVLVIPSDCLGFSLPATRSVLRSELEVYAVANDGSVKRLEAPF